MSSLNYKKNNQTLNYGLSMLMLLVITVSQNLFSQTWTSLQGPPKARNVNDLAWSADGTSLYSADKTIVFKTTNSGSSWSATGIEMVSPLVTVCKPDNASTIVIGKTAYLYRSTDAGNTWSWVLNDATLTPLRLAVSPISGQTGYMFIGRLAYSSTSSIQCSSNSGISWFTPTTYPSGVDVADIAPYPKTGNSRDQHVWAATSSGVYQSTDLGDHWSAKGMSSQNVTAVSIKPDGPPVLWVGKSNGDIYASTNEGTSWNYQTNVTTSVRAIRVRDNTGGSGNWEIYVANTYAIYKSTNNGGSWSSNLLATDASDISNIRSFIIPEGVTNQSTMYVSADNGVWKSTNGGANWSRADAGLGRMAVSYATANGSNYWAIMKDLVTVSKYDGSSWSNLDITNFYSGHIMRNTNNGYLYLSGVIDNKAGLYRSTNDGSSFSSVYTSSSQASGYTFKGSTVNPNDNTSMYVWGKDGTTANFYRIASYGTGTREPYTVGGSASNTVNDVATIGTQTIYYGLDAIGVYKSTAGPSNGNQVLSSVSVRSLAVNSGVSDIVYAAGSFGLKKTTNGGSSWTSYTTNNLKRVILSPGYSSSTSNVLFLTNDGNTIYYSSDGGANYSQAQGNLPTPIYDITGVAGSPSVVYAMTESGLYQFQAPGTAPTLSSPADQASVGAITTLTWNAVSGVSTYHLQIATNSNFSSLVVDIPNGAWTSYLATTLDVGTYYWRVASTNFVGESGYSSARSFTITDVGSITLSVTSFTGGDGQKHPRLSWSHSGQGSNPTFYLFRYPCAYGGGDCGAWPYPLLVSTTGTQYDDNSITITPKLETPTTTHYYQVRSAGISNKETANSGSGGGGEEQKTIIISDILPGETTLKGSYPNPFNPTTDIKYDLSEDGFVNLSVYDLLGKEVKVLVNEFQSAGSKDIEFNASQLPSGVYFIRFAAGRVFQTSKILLAR